MKCKKKVWNHVLSLWSVKGEIRSDLFLVVAKSRNIKYIILRCVPAFSLKYFTFQPAVPHFVRRVGNCISTKLYFRLGRVITKYINMLHHEINIMSVSPWGQTITLYMEEVDCCVRGLTGWNNNALLCQLSDDDSNLRKVRY